MSARKKTTAACALETEVEALRSLLRELRLEQRTYVLRLERMVADFVCGDCGHPCDQHLGWNLDLCGRCQRDGPAKGHRAPSRHPFVPEVRKR